MAVSRKLRLKAVWLLLVPFFWWARPTPELLAIGGLLAAVGLAIRASAAGFIHKDRELTVSGPYARTRNPLYLGSFLLGLGITVAGGQWAFVAVFLAFFAWVYSRVIRQEAEHLQASFGPAYDEYARHVPLFLPRLSAWPGPGGGGGGGQAGGPAGDVGSFGSAGASVPEADLGSIGSTGASTPAGASVSPDAVASAGAPSFSVERWRRNREYEALLGAVAGFAGLIARMLLG
ncbi:methyltransferase family protein [Gaopeijia maritima]|uniref:Isoprenylcysteine carboxylmethyltransferase family protein n=1 Tax=Gaopeijia maritima TaxID=3119007 RepID=A0ABU9E9N2_9BACT